MASAIERRIIPLLVAGNGRGAHAMLPYLTRHNRTSQSTEMVLACVDPVVGKASAFAQGARLHGVQAEAVEATVEHVLETDRLHGAMVVYCAVDRPGAVKAAVRGARARGLPCIGYFLLAMPEPQRKLLGVQFVVAADEQAAHADLDLFLDTLARIVPRGGSADVFQSAGGLQTHLSEPAIRAEFAEHLTKNAPKVVAGLEPESPPLEVATGDRVSTLYVVDHADGWATTGVLWADLLNRPDVGLRRGSSLVVAEVGPSDALRFHEARVRVTDGGLVFGPLVAAVSRGQLERQQQERLRKEVERERQVEASTLSRLSPIGMTD
jgi:hypothetical protein